MLPGLIWYIETAVKLEAQSRLIAWSNLLFSALMGIVLVCLWAVALKQERWAGWLGGAFLIDAGISFVKISSFGDWTLGRRILLPAMVFVIARDLVSGGRLKTPDWLRNFLKRFDQSNQPENDGYHFAKWLGDFLSSALNWKLLLFLVALILSTVQLHYHLFAPFDRFPLMVTVGFVAIRFGWALANNIGARKSTFFKGVAGGYKGLAILAGIFCLVYALHPWMVITNFGFNVKDWWGEDLRDFTLIATLDKFLLIAVGFVKLALFLGALLVLLRALGTLLVKPDLLEDVIQKDADFFDGKYKGGIQQVLGSDLGADLISIDIRMPGSKTRAWWGWIDPTYKQSLGKKPFEEIAKSLHTKGYNLHEDKPGPMILEMLEDDPDITHQVMETGKTIVSEDDDTPDKIWASYVCLVPGMSAFAILPIFFQGGVIGTLDIETREKGKLIPSIIRLGKRYARMLSGSVQARREMNATELLRRRLGRSAKEGLPLIDLATQLCGETQVVLENQAVCLLLSLGFERVLVGVNHTGKNFTKRLDLSSEPEEELKSIMKELDIKEPEKWAVNSCALDIPYGEGETHLGLLLLVNPSTDPPNHPSLGRGLLLGKSIAGMFTNAILEGVKGFSAKLLIALQRDLDGKQRLPITEWPQILTPHLAPCGILWLTLRTETKDGPEMVGEDGLVLPEMEKEVSVKDLSYIPLEPAHKQANTLIKLPLGQKTCLYLGIHSVATKYCLALTNSPWYEFLDHFREIATNALERIHFNRREQMISQLKIKAQRGIVQDLWLHELGNVANRIEMATDLSLDYIENQEYEKCSKKLGLLAAESLGFKELAKRLNRPLNYDDMRTNYSLKEVVSAVQSYFQIILESKKIQFETRIDPEVRLGIPYSYAYLALSNLLTNAMKAMKGQKRKIMTIRSEQSDSLIICLFEDTGKGVAEGDRERIFQQGFTTNKNHAGYGLAGVRELLREVGGDLFLDPTYQQGARFVLALPPASDQEVIT